MASLAQITANRLNAQASTGPRTEAGKAAVAQNASTHGLSGRAFALLPNEDPAAFAALLDGLEAEHAPQTPTEAFLVLELARAQWKIERINAIESEILHGEAGAWSAVAARFVSGDSVDGAIAKLNRYEQTARRAWYQALNQILKLRSAAGTAQRRSAAERRKDQAAMIEAFLEAPIPLPRPSVPAKKADCETKPMPAHLQKELDSHKRRDPLFDPRNDRSQMSAELQKYFAKQGL